MMYLYYGEMSRTPSSYPMQQPAARRISEGGRAGGWNCPFMILLLFSSRFTCVTGNPVEVWSGSPQG